MREMANGTLYSLLIRLFCPSITGQVSEISALLLQTRPFHAIFKARGNGSAKKIGINPVEQFDLIRLIFVLFSLIDSILYSTVQLARMKNAL